MRMLHVNMINNYKSMDFKIKLVGFFLLSGLSAYLTESTIRVFAFLRRSHRADDDGFHVCESAPDLQPH